MASLTVPPLRSPGRCALALGLFIGCAPSPLPPPLDGGADLVTSTDGARPPDLGGRAPKQHRAAREACPKDRGPGMCDVVGGGPPLMCKADAECAKGSNGRCVGNAHDGCYCTYDACFADAECKGGPCACRAGARFSPGANLCLLGNCQIDADCGAGGFCSPSLGDCGNYLGTVGYYCHTAKDECVDDEDCKAGPGGPPYCKYNPMVGRWQCSSSHCVG